jgi:hypothetical protein
VALSTRAARTMKQSCGRASRIALTALLFTEHLDLTGWTVQSTRCGSTARPDRGDGVLNPPSLDVAGDLECVQRCWRRFPDGRILTAWSLASFTKPGDLQVLGLCPDGAVVGGSPQEAALGARVCGHRMPLRRLGFAQHAD